jgi:hypothetical protein
MIADHLVSLRAMTTQTIRPIIFAVVAALGVAATSDGLAAKRKPRPGIFGTINGRKLKATNVNGADDPCVNGIFEPAQAIIVFSALECKGKRRRQGTAIRIRKRLYKVLVMSCANFDPALDTSSLPYEIPCIASVYAEYRTGRFGIPVSGTQWGATPDFTGSVPTSSVRMRIDAFDGTTVRGAIFGAFDDLDLPPVIAGTPPTAPAAIEGELLFDFPFRIQ